MPGDFSQSENSHHNQKTLKASASRHQPLRARHPQRPRSILCRISRAHDPRRLEGRKTGIQNAAPPPYRKTGRRRRAERQSCQRHPAPSSCSRRTCQRRLKAPPVARREQGPINLFRPIRQPVIGSRRCGPFLSPSHERIWDDGVKNRVDTVRLNVINDACQFRLSFRCCLSIIGSSRGPGCVGHPGLRSANWTQTIRKSRVSPAAGQARKSCASAFAPAKRSTS